VTLYSFIHLSGLIDDDKKKGAGIINKMKEDQSININTLISAGLEEQEAIVYELLLQKGELRAGEIIKKTALKRGNVYNILKSLTSLGFVEEFAVNGINHYRPLHPSKIANAFEHKIEEIEQKKSVFENVLPDLVSLYKLNQYKSTIRYFEGEEGVQKALLETLNYKGDVYAYIDIDSVNQWAEALDKRYIRERNNKKINKKILYFDSPLARDFIKEKRSFTEEKIIPGSSGVYQTESTIQIFEEVVLYLTFSENHKIAVIINDIRIAQFHRRLFEAEWKSIDSSILAQQNQDH